MGISVYLLVVGELGPVLPPLGEVEHDRIHDQLHHKLMSRPPIMGAAMRHGVGTSAVGQRSGTKPIIAAATVMALGRMRLTAPSCTAA